MLPAFVVPLILISGILADERIENPIGALRSPDSFVVETEEARPNDTSQAASR